jgi:dTDP-4-amino-4,6-dideoxygalactose transaminase
VPLHRQPCFAAMGFDPRDFPVCERYTAELLSLPLFTGMTSDQLNYVCEGVRAFYARR